MDSESDLLRDMKAVFETSKGAWADKNKSVKNLVEKSFPVGTEVIPILEELSRQGFTIYEYRLEGWRAWPEGQLQKYPKHTISKLADGQIRYSAVSNYGVPLAGYQANVSITSEGGCAIDVSGGIYPLML